MSMDMNNPETIELVAAVKLGIAGQRFLESDLGGYMVERCIADRQQALLDLGEAKPTDSIEINRLQNEARVPRMIVQYINDCIQEGQQAERELLGADE